MGYNQGTRRNIVVYAHDLNEAQEKFEACQAVEEDVPQIKIVIICDEDHVVKSLRELADAVDNDDIDIKDYEYEDSYCSATFSEES